MANLSLSFTLTNGTTADASEVQTNFNDTVTYVNNRNDGTADWDFVSSAGLITAKANVRVNNGTAALPPVAFTGDINTGMFWITTDELGLSAGGAQKLRITQTLIEPEVPIEEQLGTVGAPSYTFTGDTNTGIFSPGADQVSFVAGGTNQLNLTSTEIRNNPALSLSVGSTSNPFSVAYFGDGTEALPAYTFGSDVDTGMFNVGADNLGLSTGGTQRFDISTSAVTSTLPFLAPVGAVGAPSYSFTGDTDTGMFHPSANQVTLTAGGTNQVNLTSTEVRNSPALSMSIGSATNSFSIAYFGDGTGALPAYTFGGDVDTGMFNVGADNLGLSTGGTQRFDISTSAITSTLPFLAPAGSVGAPSYTFTGDLDTGMFHPSSNQVTLTAGGTNEFNLTATAARNSPAESIDIGTAGNQFGHCFMGANSAAAPSYTFGSDADTGMFSGGTNAIGFSTAGTQRWTINGSGHLLPFADGAYVVGNSSTKPAAVYATNFRMTDGVTAPSTESGIAQLYVKSSDGDLYIKFGDGTEKLIVTDT